MSTSADVSGGGLDVVVVVGSFCTADVESEDVQRD
jgi:hypothetical protein